MGFAADRKGGALILKSGVRDRGPACVIEGPVRNSGPYGCRRSALFAQTRRGEVDTSN